MVGGVDGLRPAWPQRHGSLVLLPGGPVQIPLQEEVAQEDGGLEIPLRLRLDLLEERHGVFADAGGEQLPSRPEEIPDLLQDPGGLPVVPRLLVVLSRLGALPQPLQRDGRGPRLARRRVHLGGALLVAVPRVHLGGFGVLANALIHLAGTPPESARLELRGRVRLAPFGQVPLPLHDVQFRLPAQLSAESRRLVEPLMAHQEAQSGLPLPGLAILLRRLHLHAVVLQDGARLGGLAGLDERLRAAPRQRPGGDGRRLGFRRHPPLAAQRSLEELGRVAILPHLETQVAGAIERVDLDIQRRGPLQISGPLGGFGRLDVVPPFLVEGRRPQVVAGTRVHLARPEGLVPLLVLPGRLGRLVLVLPDPPRLQIGSSALVGVGGGLPVTQLLVEMPRLQVVSPPGQAPCRATVRRAGAAVPEEAWDPPHDPEDEEAEDDGTGGGTGGKIADQTLPRGQPFAHGVGTRGGLLRRLGGRQGGNEYPAQQHRQQTEDRQGATADRGEGPSRGGPGYEATRCRGVHQSNPPVWGRRIQAVGRVGDNRSRRPGGAAGGEGRPTARRRASPAAHEDHRSALARSSSS